MVFNKVIYTFIVSEGFSLGFVGCSKKRLEQRALHYSLRRGCCGVCLCAVLDQPQVFISMEACSLCAILTNLNIC